MVAIVTRAGKGSPLTNAEVDANFVNLNNALPATGVGDMMRVNNLSDLLSIANARNNLGLGALATLNAVGAAQITDGAVTAAKLAAGAAVGNIGYTPANKAGETFTGAVDVPWLTVRLPGLLLMATAAGANRFTWLLQNSEAAGNVGSDLTLNTYDNAGAYTGTPLTIRRSDGTATFANNVTAAGNITANGGFLFMSAAAAANRWSIYQTAGLHRWTTGVNGGAEGGANGGSDYAINSYNDAGAYLGTPLTIARATGAVNIASGLNVNAGNLASFTPIIWGKPGGGWRWVSSINADGAGNAGASLYFSAWNDVGAIGNVLTLNRDLTANFGGDISFIAGGFTDTPEPRGRYWGINSLAASYTLVLVDKGRLMFMNTASANVVTVPPASAVAFPIGTRIDLINWGAGQMTVAPGAGVAMGSPGFKRKLNQYGAASLVLVAGDTWMLAGDLAA